MVEKDTVVGGTTGVSGGVMWIPQNAHMAEAGIEDSRADALAYINRLADGARPTRRSSRCSSILRRRCWRT